MVSLFCIRSITSKRWFLKIIQVTMKHDSFDAMKESMWTLHPSCIHILCWSLKRSVKRTWPGSAFSTNESAWDVLVTGSQSRVWSGPQLLDVSLNLVLLANKHGYPRQSHIAQLLHFRPHTTQYDNWGPLHTRDWKPVTITSQALSLVEKAEPVKFASHYAWGTDGVCECKMDVKSP